MAKAAPRDRQRSSGAPSLYALGLACPRDAIIFVVPFARSRMVTLLMKGLRVAVETGFATLSVRR